MSCEARTIRGFDLLMTPGVLYSINAASIDSFLYYRYRLPYLRLAESVGPTLGSRFYRLPGAVI